MTNINRFKAIYDFKHSIENLELSIRLFHEGNFSAYRLVAVQLRILLCDKNQRRSNALLPRIFLDIKLHPVFRYQQLSENLRSKISFQITAPFVIDNYNAKVEAVFDETRDPIELEEWLNQELFSQSITIYQFIRSVADKESAHSDPDYDDTLRTTKSVRLGREDLHPRFIVAIGEYILRSFKPIADKLIIRAMEEEENSR